MTRTEYAQTYAALLSKKKQIERELENLKSLILKHAIPGNSERIGDLYIQWQEPMGMIDTKRLQLEHPKIDWNQFRKPSTSRFAFFLSDSVPLKFRKRPLPASILFRPDVEV